MRCVVTGAIGFVGLNVTRELAQQGHDVIAITRRKPDDWATRFLGTLLTRVTFVVADLSVSGTLASALAGHRFDVLIHAAVVTATTEQVERDESQRIVDVNIGGTMDALDVAHRHGASRFVYVSSPSAIGNVPHEAPLDEETVTNPTTIYGITKRASEQLVRRYSELHGLTTVSVRIAQPYGPGERVTPSRARTSPIYEWLVAASNGDRLVTGPLDNGRDWTYVDDTARGIAMLAAADSTLRHGLYHLNRSALVSVEDVIELLRQRYPELTIDDRPDAPGLNPNISGPGRLPLDNSRFAAEFGWTPSTGIAEGMSRYLGWWTSSITRSTSAR